MRVRSRGTRADGRLALRRTGAASLRHFEFRPEMSTSSSKTLLASSLMAMLLCLLCSASQVRRCCRDGTCPCRLYDVLRGRGDHAAGILTLGKRQKPERRVQSRLYRLLQGSRDQTAGILAVGKRAGPGGGRGSPAGALPL